MKPQAAAEWVTSKPVTDALLRIRAEEAARPLGERLIDALHDANREFCIDWGRGADARTLFWCDVEEEFRARRGTGDTKRERLFGSDIEMALRWLLDK